jgi:uncharacterized protein (DUF1778 family)
MTESPTPPLPELSAAEISRTLLKSETIQLRVTPAEKELIKVAASKVGLTVTDYLVRIGTATAGKLNEKPGE